MLKISDIYFDDDDDEEEDLKFELEKEREEDLGFELESSSILRLLVRFDLEGEE